MNNMNPIGGGSRRSSMLGPLVKDGTALAPGDPNKCREDARHCAEIARHAASPVVRDHFISLEQSCCDWPPRSNPVNSFSISSMRFPATLFLSKPREDEREKTGVIGGSMAQWPGSLFYIERMTERKFPPPWTVENEARHIASNNARSALSFHARKCSTCHS